MRRFSGEELKSLALELPEDVLKYKNFGDLEKAREAADHWLEQPVGEELKTRLRYEKYILEELPRQFPSTKADVIRLFKDKIPDFSEEDIRKMEEKNLAEWIFINGEKHYIHNLVRNIMDKDDDIRERAGIYEQLSEDKKLLLQKVQQVRQEGEVKDSFRIRATIRLKDEQFKPGMKLKVHLPIPAEGFQISDVKILDHTKGKVSIDTPDSLYRSICFQEQLQENHAFFVEYEYTVTAKYVDLWSKETKKSSVPGGMEDYLQEQYPHIRFSPYLTSLAKEIAGEEKDPLEIARRIYDYITTKVKYSYMKEYSLIPDIPQYCARNLRGDCGVQALLFITLCRICGVPAKWQSGLYANPAYVGPHDWAMFYVEPYGWLYADPSFGGSAYASGDEQRRRFYFGNLETYRMVANNAFQQDFAVKKEFMPIDPYDNQTGEIESEEKGFASYEVENTKEMI